MILIDTDLIDDNPHQVRTSYKGIPDLAQDILFWKKVLPETLGLHQIPFARATDGRYQLVFGHRRLRAFRYNAHTDEDYSKIPVQIVEYDDQQMLDGVWTENNARADFCDVERAELMQAKYKIVGTHDAVARDWGLDRSTVTGLIRLLDLPDEIKQANRDGRLSGRMTDALGRLYRSFPDSPLIPKILTHPERYTSETIRKIIQRSGRVHHVGNGRPPGRNDVPSLRLASSSSLPGVNEAASFACKQCQADAPVTDSVCIECPLVVFLNRLALKQERADKK